MNLDHLLKQADELSREQIDKRYVWLRNLLLMSSGLFGVLISFHSEKQMDHAAQLAYQLAIVLLSLGILSGSVALYGEVHLAQRLFQSQMKYIQNVRAGIKNDKPVSGKIARLFLIFELCCYVFLCSSVLLLMVYTLLR